MKLLFVLLSMGISSLMLLGCQSPAEQLHASGKPYKEIEAMKTCIVNEYNLSKKSLVIAEDGIVFDQDVSFPIEDFRETYGKECENKPISN